MCETADGIQDLARRLHPGFKADQQQDAAEFADFLSAVLDVCVRLASGPNLPVGQISYPTLRQVQCECEYFIYIYIYICHTAAEVGWRVMGFGSPRYAIGRRSLLGFHLNVFATIWGFVTKVLSHLFVQLRRF